MAEVKNGVKLAEFGTHVTIPVEQFKRLSDLWIAVRILAEGSDWKRDEGETLDQWITRTMSERS